MRPLRCCSSCSTRWTVSTRTPTWSSCSPATGRRREDALASRPGRIDLAVELPLPDAPARRRLFEIYGAGLTLDVADWEPVAAATEGTSPAFIRELFRHAALTAAEAEREAVTGEDLLAATNELKDQSGRLTASLLGAAPPG